MRSKSDQKWRIKQRRKNSFLEKENKQRIRKNKGHGTEQNFFTVNNKNMNKKEGKKEENFFSKK